MRTKKAFSRSAQPSPPIVTVAGDDLTLAVGFTPGLPTVPAPGADLTITAGSASPFEATLTKENVLSTDNGFTVTARKVGPNGELSEASANNLITSSDGLGQVLERRLQPASAEHWFGTDQLGRDIYDRIVWGSRITLYIVGLVSVIVQRQRPSASSAARS